MLSHPTQFCDAGLMVLMMILYASLGHKIAARYKAPSIPAEKLFLVVSVVTYFDRSLYAAMSK